MEGVVHSLRKKNKISEKLQAVQLSFVSNFVLKDEMCVCDSTAITCGKSCSIEINIYMNIIHINI